MSEVATETSTLPVVQYREADAAIASLAERVEGRTAVTPAGYKLVMSGLAECRNMRVAIEKQRKTLKSDALNWGRTVDGEAKRLTGLINDIEAPMIASRAEEDERKRKVAEEKAAEEARKKAEAEAAERAERERIEAEERATRQAEHETQMKLEEAELEKQKAEASRLADIESARLAKEREKMAAERMEAERLANIERERVAKERAELLKKQAEAQAILDAKAEAEAEAVAKREAEQREQAKKEFAADRKLIFEYVGHLLSVPEPACETESGKTIIRMLSTRIEEVRNAATTTPNETQEKP